MNKEIPRHTDIFGQELLVDDCVVYPSHNSMVVGKIIKINPKMIKVAKVGSKNARESNKYPVDIVKVHGPEVTMYLLKKTVR